MSAQPGIQLAESPAVYLFKDFATPAETAHIIRMAIGKLAQARVSGDKAGVVSNGRSGNNCWIEHVADSTVNDLVTRIAALVKLPLSHAESLQVIHYAETEQYAPHYDAWDIETERGKRCLSRGGQRLITCLLYLNTVEAGGETTFPKLSFNVPAVAGNLVVFSNIIEGSMQRNPASLHGGLPVKQGEKWACNLWFRQNKYR